MSKTLEQIVEELSAPFEPHEVSFRAGAVNKERTKALALAYVDPRRYQRRLDEAAAGRWETKYEHELIGGVLIVAHAGLAIDGLWRWEVGEELLPSAEDMDRYGANAYATVTAQGFKRACTAWGLGRHLYFAPMEWVAYDDARKRLTDDAALERLAKMVCVGSSRQRAPGGSQEPPGATVGAKVDSRPAQARTADGPMQTPPDPAVGAQGEAAAPQDDGPMFFLSHVDDAGRPVVVTWAGELASSELPVTAAHWTRSKATVPRGFPAAKGTLADLFVGGHVKALTVLAAMAHKEPGDEEFTGVAAALLVGLEKKEELSGDRDE